MSHNLLQIIIALITGISCLAQDNTVRIKTPQDLKHKHNCWYLLIHSLDLVDTTTGLSISDIGARLASADRLAEGDVYVDHPEFQNRDTELDSKRGEFVQIAYNLGDLLRSYGAKFIGHIPLKKVSRAFELKAKGESLAKEFGSQWVPKLPGLIEYIFIDGFITGVKVSLKDYFNEVRGKDRGDFFVNLPSTVTRLELANIGSPFPNNWTTVRNFIEIEKKGFEKIKEIKIEAKSISRSDFSLFIRSPHLVQLEELDLDECSINTADLSLIPNALPNLKSIDNFINHLPSDSRDLKTLVETSTLAFLYRKSAFLEWVYQGNSRLLKQVGHYFPNKEEETKVLEEILTQGRFQRAIGIRDLTWVSELYELIPEERKDLRSKLVDVYLEWNPIPLTLVKQVKAALGSDKNKSVYRLSEDLINRANIDTNEMLVNLKLLLEQKITQKEYEEKYKLEYDKNSHYSKWEEKLAGTTKGKDIIKGLDPVTFETVLFEIPEGGVEVKFGSIHYHRSNGLFNAPVKRLVKKSFRLRRTPVTFGQFKAYLAAHCIDHILHRFPLTNSNRNEPVQLTKNDLEKYAQWESEITGKTIRLPTEIEWEYAARSGVETKFSFGDDDTEIGDHGWYSGNNNKSYSFRPYSYRNVAQKLVNPYGIYDTVGNGSEWTSSFFDVESILDENEQKKGEITYTLRNNSGDSPSSMLEVSARHFIFKKSYYDSFNVRLVEEVP